MNAVKFSMARKRLVLPLIVSLTLIMGLLSTEKVNASTELNTFFSQQPLPAVQIDQCYAGLADTQLTSDFYLEEVVGFTILGTKTATAVEFRFDLYDAFKTHLSDRYATREGKFSPGVPIEIRRAALTGAAIPDFQEVNLWPVKSVGCSVAKILYADGTVWTNPDSPAGPP